MTPADERVLKLIAKWRASLELHAGYAKLTDDQYWLVQPWPKHQRPTAWVIQLAQQRLSDLERIVKMRLAAGDTSISEALELMSFMANLVGAQHVERFVPVAEPEQERPIEGLRANVASGDATEAPALRAAADATREMPAVESPGSIDDTGRMPALVRADATAEMPAPGAPEPRETDPPLPEDERDLEVVRDAIRLLGWGRSWHELPEAIARMAGRPDKSRVRGILKSHRAAIERQAGAGAPAH
jgi:hypothetical protein